MKEISADRIKKIELELLKDFDTVCRECGYRYSLGGGSLLGAIRHKGFIPWDDDVDVMMPRKDYEDFLSHCRTTKRPYRVISYKSNDSYLNLFAKLEAKNTVLDNGSKNDCYGVNIDIFPLDGLGDSPKEAKRNFNSTRFLRELLNASKWKRYEKSRTHAIYYEPIRFFFFIISRFVKPRKIIRKIDEKMKNKDFDRSGWAGCICGSYRNREIVPRQDFSEYIELEFEGYMFKVIKNYDRYLTQHYGDYMVLPPKQQRVSRHSFVAYELERGDLGFDENV